MNEISIKIAEIQKNGEIKKMIKWKGMNINSEDDKQKGERKSRNKIFYSNQSTTNVLICEVVLTSCYSHITDTSLVSFFPHWYRPGEIW